MRQTKYLLLFFFLIIHTVYSQISSFNEPTTVQFLNNQQSPLLLGAGLIGAAIPQDNASGFYYNPAQLGYFANENNFSVFFMPQKTELIPDMSSLTFNSFSIAAGYNFNKNKNGLPLSIGIGYIHNKMDYGSFKRTTLPDFEIVDSYDLFESFDCFSVGASFDFYLLFNLGFSVKSFSSNVAITTMDIPIESSGTAFDFGVMITAPVSKLLFNNYKFDLGNNTFIRPKTDFTLGYSLTNVGKEITRDFDLQDNVVYMYEPIETQPIPRTAKLGYTFNFGFELATKSITLDILQYSFTVEAENSLINPYYIYGIEEVEDMPFNPFYRGKYEYKNIMGDINVGKNLIRLKGDKNVIVHKGHIFKFFETLTIVTGRLNGKNYNSSKSSGIGFSTKGLFKLLSAGTNNPTINYIANHFVLEYYNTYTFIDTDYERNYKGLVISYKGFEF
ncbi:MAG: hypothetical protein V1773_13200 [bacterium]